jgi:hypothetical protein
MNDGFTLKCEGLKPFGLPSEQSNNQAKLLLTLARRVAGRIGFEYENELLIYPNYERIRVVQDESMNLTLRDDCYMRCHAKKYTTQPDGKDEGPKQKPTTTTTTTQPDGKDEGPKQKPTTTPAQCPPSVSYQPSASCQPYVAAWGAMDRELAAERRRGSMHRTPLVLGDTCEATPMLESNAYHSLAMISRVCHMALNLEEFLTNADTNVYDDFVELVSANIMAVKQSNKQSKFTANNNAVIGNIVRMFSLLILTEGGKYSLRCPEFSVPWDPVADGYAFGYGGTF